MENKTPMVSIPWDGVRSEFSLRQYYKAAAIPAVMRQLTEAIRLGDGRIQAHTAEEVAMRCGRIADAMLAEDEKRSK